MNPHVSIFIFSIDSLFISRIRWSSVDIVSFINGVRGVVYLFVMPTLLLLTRRNVKKKKKY